MCAATKHERDLDVALFITQYGAGGVERMMVQTARALTEQGLRTALVMAGAHGPYLEDLPPAVERCVLDARRLPHVLVDFLAARRPAVAISAKLGDDRTLLAARDRARVDTRVFFRVGNPLGQRLRARGINPLTRLFKLRELRALYSRADGYIAVSHGIRGDLQHWLDVPLHRIHVLPNPVVTPELHDRATEDPEHPWLQTGEAPFILGVGGLRRQKDFPTLIRAFARLRRERQCRLIILGEGRQRQRLLHLARRLGIAEDLDLPGWRQDVYAFMARAAVFALSSRWEGTANVIIEATALGTPVVATDCRYGPREVLQDGRYGQLVPTQDADALAAALLRTLDNPPPDHHIRAAAQPYELAESGRRYATALGIASAGLA